MVNGWEIVSIQNGVILLGNQIEFPHIQSKIRSQYSIDVVFEKREDKKVVAFQGTQKQKMKIEWNTIKRNEFCFLFFAKDYSKMEKCDKNQ